MSQAQEPPPAAASLLPVLEWAENAGHENMKMHLESFALCTGHINTLFNVVLVGAGGALAYASKLLEGQPTALAAAAAWVCGYLVLLAILLVVLGMKQYDVHALYNEPAHLANVAWPKEALLQVELDNLQQRIKAQVAINQTRARHLKAFRLLACATPVVALVSALYYR